MRRAILVGVGVVTATVLLSLAPVDAKDPVRTVGRLHRIDVRAKHPMAYRPSVGDLVKIYLDFPIVPEQIVDTIAPVISGHSMTLVGVLSTSQPLIVGTGQVSVFLTPRTPGPASVTLTPIVPGQKPKSFSLSFKVQPARSK